MGEAEERRAVTRRVMTALRHESTLRSLQQFDAEGRKPVVIALSIDTVEGTAARVADAGGAATVIVPQGALLTALGWAMSHEETLDLGPAENIHPYSDLGMLLVYLDTLEANQLHFRIGTPSGAVEVTEHDALSVPA